MPESMGCRPASGSGQIVPVGLALRSQPVPRIGDTSQRTFRFLVQVKKPGGDIDRLWFLRLADFIAEKALSGACAVMVEAPQDRLTLKGILHAHGEDTIQFIDQLKDDIKRFVPIDSGVYISIRMVHITYWREMIAFIQQDDGLETFDIRVHRISQQMLAQAVREVFHPNHTYPTGPAN